MRLAMERVILMKNNIFIERNDSKGEIILVNMNTCQKLIVKDSNMINKTDDEIIEIYKDFGVHSNNNRV